MKKIILILLLLPLIASSQSFNVFDIDTSEYPIMKAKFYSIDEKGDQILNHTTSDFEITENGNPAEVLSMSCPEPKTEPVSFVIAVDVSGSMSGVEIVTLKNSLKYFIDLVPNDDSEVAIIAFNSGNHYISDFTVNKSKLKSRVDALSAGGGTDFDAAFINPVAGALLAMEEAKHQNRNVIIITDGKANGDNNAIINKAKSLGTRIFGMLIKNKTPVNLEDIFNGSGGISFENIITETDYKESFTNIKHIVGNDPCEISWRSNQRCSNQIEFNISDMKTKMDYSTIIELNAQHLVILSSDKFVIDFKEESKKATFVLTSINETQNINSITFEPDFGYYEVLTQLPIKIKNNESVEIEFRFDYQTERREFSKLIINGDICNASIGLVSGNPELPFTSKLINLTHPNGGEIFNAGTDTIITWNGISNGKNISLNFSKDNGQTWDIISENHTGLSKVWKVPYIQSDNCLIQVGQKLKREYNIGMEWSKLYGGDGYDECSSIIETSDGGYLFVGSSSSDNHDLNNNKGEADIWIVKIDRSGEILWSTVYGGDKNDYASTVIETSDGGYLVAGTSESSIFQVGNKGETDFLALKLDRTGKIIWKGSYGTVEKDDLYDVVETSDGGYFLVGRTLSRLYGSKLDKYSSMIIKITNTGVYNWTTSYGGTGYDDIQKIISTGDGNYITVGTSQSRDGDLSKSGNNGSWDIWVMKLNRFGNLVSSRSYGGSGTDDAKSIFKNNKGNYIITGRSESRNGDLYSNENKGSYDYWIFEIDNNGEIVWSKTYGGPQWDVPYSAIESADGTILVAGTTSSTDGDINSQKVNYQNFWLLQLDIKGEMLWSNVYGGDSTDMIRTIIPTFDNGFIAAGSTNSNFGDFEIDKNYFLSDIWISKFIGFPPPLQSDTSDAVFSIIMPEPVIQNNDIDMGEMIVGNTKDTIVSSVICNTGDAPLHVLGVDITGGDDGDFLIPRGAGDFYLEKDQCQDMMFEFTPSALGNRTAVATIRTTIGDFTDTINIRGVGINPLIEATTDVVDFGQFELGDGKDTNVVLIKNVGADDITITETKITGPDMEQFDMVPLPSFTLVSGDDKELELNYTSIYGGRTSSIIEFHYDGVGSPLRSMLFAEGIGGEVYPQVPDAYVGDRVELGLHLGRIKPEGLDEVATNFKATVSYNSTLLAPIDKNMSVTTENTTSFIEIEGQLSGVSQIATVPMKVGLGTAVKSGLVVTEFQLYDANGDSVDYEIEPGVGEFNVLGICEEGGTRLVNPNSEKVGLRVAQNRQNTSATIYLDLIESGQTDLIIYDQLGNAVETAYSGTTNAGSKELSLDLSNYTNGRYYIKLTTPTITKTEIIEVVR